MKVKWGTGYLHTFKVSPSKLLAIYKVKNSNFIGEKPGRYHLNEVIKKTPVMGQSDIMPPDVMHWG